MQTHGATTPFGRRPMTLAMIASQATARTIREGAAVSKWAVFRHVREARQGLGATDRALAILDALLTFHRGDELSAESGLVVFPSNEQLIRRANGMSPATLRRHIAVLVECGLIIRRDSPNGKRFARKGEGGAIEQAFGFDLSPLLARAAEFEQIAAAAHAERRELKRLKERLTICRRDIVKMIDAGLNEGVPANWRAYRSRYEALVGALPRTLSLEAAATVVSRLEDLWADVHQALDSFVNSQIQNASESQNERHIQNSNTKPHSDDEPKNGLEKEHEGPADQSGFSADVPGSGNVSRLPERTLPLGMVLDACPDLLTLADGGTIRTWREFVAAAGLARPYLGISPSAWQDATEAMGPQNAAIAVAAILQRGEKIRSRGGYLRDLTERARAGKFSVWPMVMALINARMAKLEEAAEGQGADAPSRDRQPAAGTGTGSPGIGQPGPGNQAEISDALRRSLERRRW
jgi:replication initiation protein RepC